MIPLKQVKRVRKLNKSEKSWYMKEELFYFCVEEKLQCRCLLIAIRVFEKVGRYGLETCWGPRPPQTRLGHFAWPHE